MRSEIRELLKRLGITVYICYSGSRRSVFNFW